MTAKRLPTTMLDMYNEMKECLRYLGPNWGQMDKVKAIMLENGNIRFEHGGRAIETDLTFEKDE